MKNISIEFPVFVNGQKIIANVVEREESPVQFVYRVRFSDGYEDVFCLDEGWLEGDKLEQSKPYARAVRNEILNIIGLDTEKFYHVFQESIDGVITNVWVIEKEDLKGETYYGVYYNEYYRFEVRKEEKGWRSLTKFKGPDSPIDPVLAKKVEHLLYALF